MKSIFYVVAAVAVTLASGCSTSQNVLLAKQAPPTIVTIAQAPSEGNSQEMDAFLRTALIKEGYTVRAPLPAGTRTSDSVDAIISYIDVWRWDVVMYLQSITMTIFDARNGDLLVTSEWRNSAMHGYHGDEEIVQSLVSEMSNKLEGAAIDAPATATNAVGSGAADSTSAAH